jgi:hypothetical protein
LFVATGWPVGVDPLVFFTSIQAALNQAALMAPTTASPVIIYIYGSTFTENVVIPAAASSGVLLVGTKSNNTILNGSLTWAPVGAGTESFNLVHLRVNTGALILDTTGKPAGVPTNFICTNCNFNSINALGLTATGAGQNLFSMEACNYGAGAMTVESMRVEFIGCRHRGFTLNGACIGSLGGGIPIPGAAANAWTVNGTSTIKCQGTSFIQQWTFAAGTSGQFTGCLTNSNVNIAAGATVDVRASNMSAFLVGPGSANRTTQTISFGPTAIGANAVVFAIPYPDATYNVALQLSGAGDATGVYVDTKLVTGFTINDPIGGNTFDIIVTHD